MPPHSPITAFALAARVHDDVLDLEALAVAIARMGNPALTGATVHQALNALAEQVADRVDLGAPPDRLAARLSLTLGTELDFRGDPSAPPSAEASYLDRVLETRRGLPILLSTVWILVGARLGIPIRGVGYPGHFLVCLDAPGARVFLDPFHGGNQRDGTELLARLGPGTGARRLLDPCDTRALVTRILVNLKHLWVGQSDFVNALGAVDRILLIGGEQPVELRDRGLICLHLDRPAEASRDFQKYLKARPEADDRPVIEALLEKISGAT